MENRGSRPFGYWDSSYRAKLRRTWIALPFCIVAAVAGGIGLRSTLSTRLASLPAFLRTTACPMPEATNATPAESYPRYSRRCNP